MRKPLEGIQVIELGDYVSAPVCARLLADLGANVIKVERNTGNVWRLTGIANDTSWFSNDENPVYDIYNTGKDHIVLNLKTQEGMDTFMKLLETTDVFVTNNRPAALKRLGLDYDSIKDRYPGLIYAIGLGYGEKGPMAAEPAYDQTAFWARTGFVTDMALDGPHYMPSAAPFSMGDTVTGITMMGEICAALYNREFTGKGDYVRSSLYHNGIFAMGNMQIISQPPKGRKFPRTRAAWGLPNGFYRCKDGEFVFIAAGYAQHIVPKVFEMMGHPELIDDERFNNVDARKKNCEALYAILEPAMLEKTSDEWMELAKKMDIPMSPMYHFADMSTDEQAIANEYVQKVEYPNGHSDMIASSPLEMDSVGQLKTYHCHDIGQDTEKVLKEHGFTEEQLKVLREVGAIN